MEEEGGNARGVPRHVVESRETVTTVCLLESFVDRKLSTDSLHPQSQ